MRIRTILLSAAALALSGAAWADGGYDAFKEASRTPVIEASLPAAARLTLSNKADGRSISKIDQVQFADGHVSYQAEIQWPGHDAIDVEISPQGVVMGQWQKPARRGTGP